MPDLGLTRQAELVRQPDTSSPKIETGRIEQPKNAEPKQKSLFEENPIGAIGLLLSNVAAGLQGRPLPSDRLMGKELERQALNLRQTDLALRALDMGVSQLGKIPQEQRQAFIDSFGAQFKDFNFDIAGALEAISEGNIEESNRLMQVLKDIAPGLAPLAEVLGGDPKAMMSVVKEIVKQQALLPGQVAATAAQESVKRQFAKPEIREIERDGQKLLVGIGPDGDERFAIPAGAADKDFDQAQFKAALQLRSANQEVAEDLFDPKIAAAVNSMAPEEALTTLNAARGGGIEITGPDGSTIRIGGAPTGQKTREREEAKIAVQEAQPIPTAVANLVGLDTKTTIKEAREQGISIPPEKDLSDLQKAKSGARSAISIAKQIRAQIRDNPQVLAAPGAITRTFNSLRSQVIGLAKLTGVEVTASTRPEDYETDFQQAGIESSVLKSRVIDLAFAIASQREGGRLTDQDVSRAIETIGAKTGDPAAFEAVLSDAISRIDDRFQTRVQDTIGKRPVSIVSERDREILSKPMDKITPAELRELSDEGLRELENKASPRRRPPGR